MRFCGACGQALAATSAALSSGAEAPAPGFAATWAHGGLGAPSLPDVSAPATNRRRFAGTVLGVALPAEITSRTAVAPTNAPNPEFTPPAGAPALRTRKATAGFGDDVSGARRNLPTAAFRHYGTGTLEVPPALGGSPASERPPAPARSAAKPAWPRPEPQQPPTELEPWWRRPKSSLVVLSAFLAGVVLTVSVMAAAASAYLARHEQPDRLAPPPSATRVGR